MSVKNGKKGTAANHAAYIARQGKHGTADKKADLRLVSHGNLPEWAAEDPSILWKAADKYERANGAAYREYELALPSELSLEQNAELARAFIERHVGNKPYQLAIHTPIAAFGKIPQPHMHLMICDRKPDGICRLPEQFFNRHNPKHPEIGGCKKDSGGKSKQEMREQLAIVREDWARMQNSALEQNGHSARVDHRSHRDRGIDCSPEIHLGRFAINKMTDEEKLQFQERRSNKAAHLVNGT